MMVDILCHGNIKISMSTTNGERERTIQIFRAHSFDMGKADDLIGRNVPAVGEDIIFPIECTGGPGRVAETARGTVSSRALDCTSVPPTWNVYVALSDY